MATNWQRHHSRTCHNAAQRRARMPRKLVPRARQQSARIESNAALGCWLKVESGDLYPLFIGSILVFGLGVATFLFTRRRLRYPDSIITLLEGYMTFFNSALSEHPFESLGTLAIAPSSLFSGVTLVNTSIGSNKPYAVRIRSGFHQSWKIAEQIIADFNRYKR